MDRTKIGKQITLLRKEHGYTQERLAELLNVSAQAVSKWENGRALPETALKCWKWNKRLWSLRNK